ncbi:hypothetical protein CLAIMM_01267 [Cladophialophora immunda]|nr:hypothetical protein CLAIMM_01267 [Cladophialophora immunda]
MCLFHILNCSARNASELRRTLTRPSREVIAAGLIRCKWHEAVTRSDWDAQDPSKFQDPDAVCPYVVVRHDETPLPEDVVKTIVEAVYLECVPDRGCPKCEETISAEEMLGPLPTRAEKLECLRASDRSAIAKGGDASQRGVVAVPSTGQRPSEGTTGPSSVKRKHHNGKNDKGKRRDDDDDVDDASSDDIRIVEERQVKRPRLGSPLQKSIQDGSRTVSPASAASIQPANSSMAKSVPPVSEEGETSSSPASASATIGKGSSLNLSDAASRGLTHTLRSPGPPPQGSENEDALQRRKRELSLAMAVHLSAGARHSREAAPLAEKVRGPTRSPKESKENEALSMPPPALNSKRCNVIDLTRSSTVESSRSETEPPKSPTPSVEKRERAIRDHVSDAFRRLDSAAAQQKDLPLRGAETQEDGEFGPEVLRAVRDGSFQTAVEEVSRRHWDLDAPVSSSKAAGGPKGKDDTLLDSIRILRAEKAAFVDRIAGLLEEKAASMEREAALLRRVAELERMVQANGSVKAKGTISPSPSPGTR